MTSAPKALMFTITFRGPFHIGGTPSEGLDRTVDREVPLPGTSLKGSYGRRPANASESTRRSSMRSLASRRRRGALPGGGVMRISRRRLSSRVDRAHQDR